MSDPSRAPPAGDTRTPHLAGELRPTAPCQGDTPARGVQWCLTLEGDPSSEWREVGGAPPPLFAGVFQSGEPPTGDWSGKLHPVLERSQTPRAGPGVSVPHGRWGSLGSVSKGGTDSPCFGQAPFPDTGPGGDAGGRAGPGAAGAAGANPLWGGPGAQAPPAPLRGAPGCPEPPPAPVIPPREPDTGAKQRASRAAS